MPLLLPYPYVDILLREGLSLFFHLFIYWLIFLSSMGSWILILFNGTESVIIMSCFDALVVPDLTDSSLFKLAPVSFDMSPSFLEHFLIFWQDKVFWIKENREK